MTSTDLGSKVILGSVTFWLSFEKLSLYPHTLMYYHGSWTNITMIAVIAKAGRNSWFEKRLVIHIFKRSWMVSQVWVQVDIPKDYSSGRVLLRRVIIPKSFI